MDDKLFEQYQAVIAKLEWLIEQTSLDEVTNLIRQDIENWEYRENYDW